MHPGQKQISAPLSSGNHSVVAKKTVGSLLRYAKQMRGIMRLFHPILASDKRLEFFGG